MSVNEGVVTNVYCIIYGWNYFDNIFYITCTSTDFTKLIIQNNKYGIITA